MSWFSENKFTAIFGGATAVVAGALGWMVLGAKGELEARKSEFADTVSKLGNLQAGKPFPNDKNVDAYKAELSRVDGEVSKLHARLLSTELPLDDVRPNAFQDRLKQTVDRIKGDALAKKVLLPGQKKDDPSAVAADSSFNLGFSLGTKNYLDALPQDEASSDLARQLKVVEFVVQQILSHGATQLLEVKRNPLPSEGGDKPTKVDDKKPGADKKDKKGQEDLPKLVSKHKFEVKFVASQASFMKVLNSISTAQQPFIIVRRVTVRNEKVDGPLKQDPTLAVPAADPNAAPADPAVAPGTPADPAAPIAVTPGAVATPESGKEANKLLWIVGEEKLEVDLELEMVDFADAKASQPDAKAKTSK
jgi:hypothetical protein